MNENEIITPKSLRKLLSYDKKSGLFYWKKRTSNQKYDNFQISEEICKSWNTRFAGKQAFTGKFNTGYHHSAIFKKKILAHRAAWAITYGYWPSTIDHINGDRSDNRIENLREVTASENARNRAMQSNNTSGKMGVSWSKSKRKWSSYIKINKVKRHLGYFDNFNDAALARKRAEAQLGFHSNHGRPQNFTLA
jgi:hypothetical protein